MTQPYTQTILATDTGSQQDGVVLSGPVWDETTTSFSSVGGPFADLITIGVQFDLGLSFAGGLPLEPPIIQAGTIAFDGTDLIQLGTLVRTEAWFIQEYAPDPFATGDLPTDRTRTQVGRTGIPTDPVRPEVTFPDDTNYPGSTDAIIQYTRDSRWNGILAFHINITTTGGAFAVASSRHPTGDAPKVDLTLYPEHSGMVVGAFTSRARGVHDGRTGFPELSTDLIRDGDKPGTYTRPQSWDPEDPPPRYRPSHKEGVVDDDVPNR